VRILVSPLSVGGGDGSHIVHLLCFDACRSRWFRLLLRSVSADVTCAGFSAFHCVREVLRHSSRLSSAPSFSTLSSCEVELLTDSSIYLVIYRASAAQGPRQLPPPPQLERQLLEPVGRSSDSGRGTIGSTGCVRFADTLSGHVCLALPMQYTHFLSTLLVVGALNGGV
jgi:hypothetical protein